MMINALLTAVNKSGDIGTFYWELYNLSIEWALDHSWSFAMYREHPGEYTTQATLPDYTPMDFEN